MMKKLLVAAAMVLAVGVGQASAAPVNCAASTVSLATLLSNADYADGCQVTDKVFSGFSYTGDIDAANVNVVFQSNGPVPAGASIAFQGVGASWAALTLLSWTTTIDPAICATCTFVSVLDQIFTPPTPNANAGTFTHTPGGAVGVSGSAPGTLSGQVGLSGTSVLTSFTQTGGDTLQSLSSSYSQRLTPVPEPASMLLLGTGLVGLAGAARRRLKK